MSLEDFLESCRHTTLLAELTDDDELADENDEDDEYDAGGPAGGVGAEEEPLDPRPGRRHAWDDDTVLKRHCPALIPAFDPRPGRTNVAQTQDIQVSRVQLGSADGKMDWFVVVMWFDYGYR